MENLWLLYPDGEIESIFICISSLWIPDPWLAPVFSAYQEVALWVRFALAHAVFAFQCFADVEVHRFACNLFDELDKSIR